MPLTDSRSDAVRLIASCSHGIVDKMSRFSCNNPWECHHTPVHGVPLLLRSFCRHHWPLSTRYAWCCPPLRLARIGRAVSTPPPVWRTAQACGASIRVSATPGGLWTTLQDCSIGDKARAKLRRDAERSPIVETVCEHHALLPRSSPAKNDTIVHAPHLLHIGEATYFV